MPDSVLKTPKNALELEHVPLGTLIPYARNARTHSPTQVSQLAGSIAEFGFTNPVLIGADNVIIAGHGRVLAAEKLGLEEVPVIRLGHLTDAQRRAYIIADNKLALNAGWDDELLRVELADLEEMGVALGLTGFSDDELAALMADPEAGGGGDRYTREIKAPIYEPTGENPPVAALIDDTKTRELVEQIRAADLPEDIAAFLERAAERHTVFNFAKIAEFYAHAEPEVQDLMEASALVIIDFDQAVEGGFVKLSKSLAGLVGDSPVIGEDADAA
jgi:ParB-like chromosome segregation protein Spo0J